MICSNAVRNDKNKIEKFKTAMHMTEDYRVINGYERNYAFNLMEAVWQDILQDGINAIEARLSTIRTN